MKWRVRIASSAEALPEFQFVSVEAEAQFIDRGGVLNFLVFDKKAPDPETGKKRPGKPKGRSVRTFAPGVWKDIEELPAETS